MRNHTVNHRTKNVIPDSGRGSGRTYRMLQRAVHYACVNHTTDENPTVVVFKKADHRSWWEGELNHITRQLDLTFTVDERGDRARVDGNVIVFRGIGDYPCDGFFVDHWVRQLCDQEWRGDCEA